MIIAPPGVTLSQSKVTVTIEMGTVPTPPPSPTPVHARRHVTPSPSVRSRGSMPRASSAIPASSGTHPARQPSPARVPAMNSRGHLAIIDPAGDVATVKNTNKVVDPPARSRLRAHRHRDRRIGQDDALGDARASLARKTRILRQLHGAFTSSTTASSRLCELRAERIARPRVPQRDRHRGRSPPHRRRLSRAPRQCRSQRSNRMQGACALVVISADQPDRVVGARTSVRRSWSAWGAARCS